MCAISIMRRTLDELRNTLKKANFATFDLVVGAPNNVVNVGLTSRQLAQIST